VNQALLKEINEVNKCLISTVVDIGEEDISFDAAVNEVGPGTIVKCSFNAVTSGPDQIFLVLTMCLLVSSDYPNCSPVFLDKLPLELSKEQEHLLLKARSKFTRSIRCLSQPISVTEMAKSWDTCAGAVILEYSVQNGGGSFSTRYGTWKTVSNS
ncbi:Mediator of rna polymerase ii transcription subunit 15a, partial [Thalictrum thalictroides]